jgi:hypothetical protein
MTPEEKDPKEMSLEEVSAALAAKFPDSVSKSPAASPKNEEVTDDTVATPEVPAEEPKTEGKVDFSKVRSTIAEGKELDASTLASLEAIGIDKDTLNDVVASYKNRAATIDAAVMKAAGTKEEYDKAAAWAKDELSDKAREKYNKDIMGADPAARDAAVKNLMTLYRTASGTAAPVVPKVPTRIVGGATTGGGVKPITRSEFIAARNSPEWKNEAFQQKILARLAATNPDDLGF